MQERKDQILAVALGIVATLGLVGCGSSSANQGAAADARLAEPQQVRTAQVERVTVPDTLDATGELLARESSAVAPQADGMVAATPVEMGAFVARGAVLVQLSTATAELNLQDALAAEQQALAALRQAEARLGVAKGGELSANPEAAAARANLESMEANLRLAEAEEQRSKTLRATGDVSQSAYDRAFAQLRSAQAQRNAARQQYQAALDVARQSVGGVDAARAALDAARVRVAIARKALADTTIRAPFAGYVSARNVSPGEFVSTSTAVATVDMVHPIRLQLRIPEVSAGRLATGMTVEATLQAFPNKVFTGTLTAVNPSLDPASRSFIAEASLPNTDGLLRPGMFATARILLKQDRELFAVPADAAHEDQATDSAYVWILAEGKARMRPVHLARRTADRAYLADGIASGERVIRGSRNTLFDGAPVTVAPAKAAQPATGE